MRTSPPLHSLPPSAPATASPIPTQPLFCSANVPLPTHSTQPPTSANVTSRTTIMATFVSANSISFLPNITTTSNMVFVNLVLKNASAPNLAAYLAQATPCEILSLLKYQFVNVY